LKKEILILVFLLFSYCSKNTKPEITNPDEEFEQAVQYFEEEDYNKTINFLRYFFNRYPGSHWIDDAQFYYAESYYKLENYTDAISEFQFLLNNFPNSNWSELALLRKAQCLEKVAPIPQRDQTLTKEAIETYKEFIRKYPYSKYLEEAKAGKRKAEERINKKLLEIGEIYIKMGIGDAAIIYLKKVTEESEKWKNKANLLLGDIASSDNNDSLAASYYLKVEGELKEQAQEKLKEIN
jgi:outer membrane protein assembly factor BamD